MIVNGFFATADGGEHAISCPCFFPPRHLHSGRPADTYPPHPTHQTDHGLHATLLSSRPCCLGLRLTCRCRLSPSPTGMTSQALGGRGRCRARCRSAQSFRQTAGLPSLLDRRTEDVGWSAVVRPETDPQRHSADRQAARHPFYLCSAILARPWRRLLLVVPPFFFLRRQSQQAALSTLGLSLFFFSMCVLSVGVGSCQQRRGRGEEKGIAASISHCPSRILLPSRSKAPRVARDRDPQSSTAFSARPRALSPLCVCGVWTSLSGPKSQPLRKWKNVQMAANSVERTGLRRCASSTGSRLQITY